MKYGLQTITYIQLGNGFVFLAVVMDMYTRVIRGYALGTTMEQALTLEAFDCLANTGSTSVG